MSSSDPIGARAGPPCLFVYGTLMRRAAGWRFGKRERDRLAGESTFVAEATLRARVYDLGSYPGLVLSDDPADVVHGEVLRLADPAASFVWLDPYESIGPADHPDNEYRRVVVQVRTETGAALEVWTYVYNRDLGHLTPVPGGRWAATS